MKKDIPEKKIAERRSEKGSGHALCRTALLVLASAALIPAGCGSKKDPEKTTMILTAESVGAAVVKETAGTASSGAAERETRAPEDVVNGFRFETCDEMVYCIGEGVKIRRSPGLDGEAVGHLQYGAYVQRIGKNSKWSRILVNGQRVYAAAEYLSPYPPGKTSP